MQNKKFHFQFKCYTKCSIINTARCNWSQKMHVFCTGSHWTIILKSFEQDLANLRSRDYRLIVLWRKYVCSRSLTSIERKLTKQIFLRKANSSTKSWKVSSQFMHLTKWKEISWRRFWWMTQAADKVNLFFDEKEKIKQRIQGMTLSMTYITV